jgi:hypothetical protein
LLQCFTPPQREHAASESLDSHASVPQAGVVGDIETVVCMITYPPMYSFNSPGTLSMSAMTRAIMQLPDNSRSTGDEKVG